MALSCAGAIALLDPSMRDRAYSNCTTIGIMSIDPRDSFVNRPVTINNHVWCQKEVYAFLVTHERIVRPANYPSGAPGAGSPCGRPPTAARWPSSTWPASCS